MDALRSYRINLAHRRPIGQYRVNYSGGYRRYFTVRREGVNTWHVLWRAADPGRAIFPSGPPDVACGFQFDNQTDEVLGRADVPTVDAQLRLPAGTKICSWDRFRLTHRLGVELAEYIDFEIHGEPKIGPSGIVCELMQAKDVTRL